MATTCDITSQDKLKHHDWHPQWSLTLPLLPWQHRPRKEVWNFPMAGQEKLVAQSASWTHQIAIDWVRWQSWPVHLPRRHLTSHHRLPWTTLAFPFRFDLLFPRFASLWPRTQRQRHSHKWKPASSRVHDNKVTEWPSYKERFDQLYLEHMQSELQNAQCPRSVSPVTNWLPPDTLDWYTWMSDSYMLQLLVWLSPDKSEWHLNEWHSSDTPDSVACTQCTWSHDWLTHTWYTWLTRLESDTVTPVVSSKWQIFLRG